MKYQMSTLYKYAEQKFDDDDDDDDGDDHDHDDGDDVSYPCYAGACTLPAESQAWERKIFEHIKIIFKNVQIFKIFKNILPVEPGLEKKKIQT